MRWFDRKTADNGLGRYFPSALAWARWRNAAVAAAGLGLAGVPGVAAQTLPPANGWGTSTEAAPPGSSVMPRQTAPGAAPATLALSAVLSEEGQPIEQGLSWFIFQAEPGADGKRPLAARSKDATPQFQLEPGVYYATAAFGRATLTHKLTLATGQKLADKFNLDAGGLRINAVLPSGEKAPEKTVVFDVLNEERDQAGNRIKVVSAARPGLILRLHGGVYQVVSTYGDANAKVRAEVTVYPGKLTEATLNQTGAKVTFKLVGRPGGEALADVAWSIIDTKAQTVKETAGAVPTHILAAGRYAVLAKHQDRTFRVEFTAKPGDSTIVEVVAK